MMTITISELHNRIFLELYNVFNSNLTDPLSRGKQWIFSSPNIIFANNFIGYPIIIVDKASVKRIYDTLERVQATVMFRSEITILSTNNRQLDELSADVYNILNEDYFPQFDFKSYDEDTGQFNDGSTPVFYRRILISVELRGVYD